MILIDTHIWVWWINDTSKLKPSVLSYLDNLNPEDIHISIISCWEVAKLVEKERLVLEKSLQEWFEIAINNSGITVLPLDLEIIMDSCNLPQPFHNDPADQLIVGTSRVKNIELLTVDAKILDYDFVNTYK
jgi:PIN domain nuclease of toxin-antitoxin system